MELAVDENSKAMTPAQMVSVAVQQGADIEKLEKLMELEERWEARQAKKAYDQALVKFRAECPPIPKTRRVDYGHKGGGGRTQYRYPGLAETDALVRPYLSANDLAATWRTSQDGERITVTCRLSHSQGHYEETSLTGSPDMTGSKNPLQAIDSTVTYLERYTFFALLGLSASEDDDGGGLKRISEEQARNIVALIEELDADKDKLLKWLQVETVEDIPADRYKETVAAIERKRKR
jgi:hypothetical protein